jgi:hypothetical protein
MNKTLSTLALVFAVGGATAPAARADDAGSCHFHGSKPATESTVVGCATQRKDALVKSGKLDASWQPIKHDAAALVDGKKGKEWKVTFRNPSEKDAGKATLYMFYTPVGNFIAANFTGQ